MFRANQTAYLTTVLESVLGKWDAAREQNSKSVVNHKTTNLNDVTPSGPIRRSRRRRWRNRRLTGISNGLSGSFKTGWS